MKGEGGEEKVMDAMLMHDFEDIWRRVKDWPEDLRALLASKILSSQQGESALPRKAIAELVGILSSDSPPPSDEDVRRIVEEERMRRLG